MDNSPNSAGKSTREMATKRKRTLLWIGIGSILIILVLFFLMQNSTSLGLGWIGFALILFGIPVARSISEVLMNKKYREGKRAIRGAKAEENIGGILDQLTEEYLVMHDVRCPYGNIDHVVIHKSGQIFLLETKAHGGKVRLEGDILLVNGKPPEKDFIAQTARNTLWLNETIQSITNSKVWINPRIVFTNAFVVAAKPVKGISVINSKFLLSTLKPTNQKISDHPTVWDNKDKIVAVLNSTSTTR